MTTLSDLSYIPDAPMEVDDNITPPLPPSNPPFQPPLPAGPHPSEISANQKKFTYPCRDYTNGYCKRGDECKFSHKVDHSVLVFCHDFQNKKCMRPYCKFLHCYREEEADFLKTGKLPEAAVKECMRNRKPVCPDYAVGNCQYSANDCEFRHVLEPKKEKKFSTISSASIPPLPPPTPMPPMTAPPPIPPPPQTLPPEMQTHVPPPMFTQIPPIPPTPSLLNIGVPMQQPDPHSVQQTGDNLCVIDLTSPKIPSSLKTDLVVPEIQVNVPPPCILFQQECNRLAHGIRLEQMLSELEISFEKEKEQSNSFATEINGFYLLEREDNNPISETQTRLQMMTTLNEANSSNQNKQEESFDPVTELVNAQTRSLSSMPMDSHLGLLLQMNQPQTQRSQLPSNNPQNTMGQLPPNNQQNPMSQLPSNNPQNTMSQLPPNNQQNPMSQLPSNNQQNTMSQLPPNNQQNPMSQLPSNNQQNTMSQLPSNNQQNTMSQSTMSQNQASHMSNLMQQQSAMSQRVESNTMPQIMNTGSAQQMYSNERQQQLQYMPGDWNQQYLAGDRQFMSQPPTKEMFNQMMNNPANQQYIRSNMMPYQQDFIDAYMINQQNTMPSMQMGPNYVLDTNTSTY